jgi:hypothetical protein
LVLAVTAAAGLAGGSSRQIPADWKLSADPSGSCQVATPADWQLGRDFFLERESADAGPTGRGPRRLPPRGFALWRVDGRDRATATRPPSGKRYQIRTSVVHEEAVCSVWRITGPTDFTAAEKNTMAQVGKTLRWVR